MLQSTDTLVSLANLYNDQGCYQEAEPLYQRALTISEKVLGLNHPDTAISLYESQGKYEHAEPLFQRALAIMEKTYSPN